MSTPAPDSAEVARRLWDAGAASRSSNADVAVHVEECCSRLRVSLARWIGAESYDILLARVLSELRREHPALRDLTCCGAVDGPLREAIRAHGADRVQASFTALVARLIEALGRVIGADMAARLVEQACLAPSDEHADALRKKSASPRGTPGADP